MNQLNPTSFAEVARLHRSVTNGLKGTLVVTCTQSGEGVSLTSYLLARRSAEDGKKTLFIDLNLKNTFFTQKLGLKPQLWNIAQLAKLEELADLAVEHIQGLDVLPAPSDQESVRWLCEQEQAKMLFKALEKRYDHIVVDTTPLTATNRNNADPVLLAAAAERVLLVLLSGVTHRDKVKQAVQDLQTAGANLVGISVNDKFYQSAQDTIFKLAHGLRRVSPGLSSWLEHRARTAELRN
ncbi:MAG: AAA family ATPase [Alphaproteobacteria bacterium]|nr:AAA family ATPase [Alphaproteobacteria bacterium]MDD9919087.1 AAA family ATPase [Alphaproteobacteria bacterium]